MAFNILCLARDPLIEAKFHTLLDGLPLELVAVEPEVFAQQDLTFIDQYRPHCILQCLPDSHVIDAQYVADTARLNQYSCEHNIHFIQLSSTLFFGDEPRHSPQSESAAPGDNAIAQQFAELEHIVAQNSKALVLRTSWLLNHQAEGVFARILPLMFERDASLAVSDHNFGNPIHIRFLVDSLIAIVRQQLCGAQNSGVYHLCSADSASEAEIADHLVRLLNTHYNQQLSLPAIAGAGDNRTAMPVNAQLLAKRVTHGFGVQLPTWRKGFKALFDHWLNEHGRQIPQLANVRLVNVEPSEKTGQDAS